MLPPDDLEHLKSLDLEFDVSSEGGMTCVVINDFPLPAGYSEPKTELLLRLPPGFPDLPPDMWWMWPGVTYADGQVPQATEVREVHLGKEWQRWSRHFGEAQWRPGRDSLQSFLRLIRTDLENGVRSK